MMIVFKEELFGDKLVETVIINGVQWIRSTSAAAALGYTDVAKCTRRHVSKENKAKFKDLIIQLNFEKITYNQGMKIYINLDGLMELLNFSKMPNKESLIHFCGKKYGIKYKIITKLDKEQENIGIIMTAFRHFSHKRQYRVNSFKIDLYFIDQKLAIECDEFDHACRDHTYEI